MATEIARAIGVGVGAAIGESGAVTEGSKLISQGASKATDLAVSGVGKSVRVGFSAAEKMMVASIIVICIILIFIGLGLLMNQFYKSGSMIGLFGLVGLGGAIYWSRNSATASVLGLGEDDELSPGDLDFQELDGDLDELPMHYDSAKPDDKSLKQVSFDFDKSGKLEESEESGKTGSHEQEMLSELQQLVSIMENAEVNTDQSFANVNSISETAGATNQKILDALNATLENRDKLRVAYKKMDPAMQTKYKDVLANLKKLAVEMQEKSHSIEGKLLELIESLEA